jgi:hypothetical protein
VTSNQLASSDGASIEAIPSLTAFRSKIAFTMLAVMGDCGYTIDTDIINKPTELLQ